jgi:hypothetical protein
MGAFENTDGTRTVNPVSQTSTPVIAERESTFQSGSTATAAPFGSPALDPDRASTTALGDTKKNTNGGV